jgi:putative ABC transport system ATP-binding protein
MVGLADRLTHQPSELSGGQQQRVAVARALVTHPAIILADEPTGNLDTQASADVMRLLQDLNITQGLTVVLVTHEADIAAYAERVVQMRDGLVLSDVSRGGSRIVPAQPAGIVAEARAEMGGPA